MTGILQPNANYFRKTSFGPPTNMVKRNLPATGISVQDHKLFTRSKSIKIVECVVALDLSQIALALKWDAER